MPNVSFQAPTDYGAEAEAIARQRKYAELMQQQSQEPLQGQMAGQFYVAPSWTQGAAKLAQALSSKHQMNRADANQKALAERLRAQGMSDVSAFTEAMQGTPARPANSDVTQSAKSMDSFDPTPAVDAVPGDRKRALAIALQSQNPTVAGAGQQMLAQLLKQDDPYSLREGEKRFGPNGQVIASNDKVRSHVVNGQVVRETDTGITPLGQAIPHQSNPYGDLVVPDGKGGVMPNKQLVDVKTQLAQAGKPSIQSTVINAGPKAFETELGKMDAEKLGELRKNAQAANNALNVVGNLRNAVNQGVYSGGGANAKVAVANLIGGLTGQDPKKLAASQVFNAEASKLVLEHVKELGANPSNADRDFIEKTVPMLATSPQARDALMQFIEQRAGKAINLYKGADTHARKNHGLGGFDLMNNNPENTVDFNTLPK
jgi:hypothetical protein